MMRNNEIKALCEIQIQVSKIIHVSVEVACVYSHLATSRLKILFMFSVGISVLSQQYQQLIKITPSCNKVLFLL